VAVTDGTSLFVATGNTFGARTWSDGEAVIRLAPDLHRSDDKRDFFAPSDWEALDARDADLGGSNPLPLEVPGGGPPLILALGKDRKAYLLDRNNLGGIGGQLAVETVSDRAIITAPGNLSCGGRHFRRTSSRKHTLFNSGAGTSHPQNPARFAVGHYDSLVRISTWQKALR
jgi:hypothetical protein